MDLRLSREATTERFGRKNSQQFEFSPLFRKLAGRFITSLADYFSGKQSVIDYPAPACLAEAIKNIQPEVLALATLAPVLNAWYRGGLNKKSPLRDLKQKIGEKLDEHSRLNWDNIERVQAGGWMFEAAWLNMSCFRLGDKGIREITPASEAELNRLRDEMMRNDPAWCPFPKPQRDISISRQTPGY